MTLTNLSNNLRPPLPRWVLEAAATEAIEQQRRKQQAQTRIRQLEFRGNNLQIQSWVNPPHPGEWILSGGSETGKTYASLALLDKIARQYKNARGAIIRKWHVDLASTVLDIYKREFLDYSQDVKIFGGESPIFYDYPTGTRIWTAGIDRPGKVLSGALDFIYVNQAEELDLGDWETLTTRATGRAGVIVPGLLFGDCNPLGSNHFILQRVKAGSLTLLPTYHTDNPTLYDEQGNLTEQGKHTDARLSSLTGMRRKRLYEGLWVTPEGVVYDTFDREIHVKKRDLKEFTHFALTLDEGYTHPAVILFVGIDADLRLHIIKEFYKSGVLPSEHVHATIQWARQANANLIVVDASAAGLIAELANQGITAHSSKGHVRQGIGLVHELLKVQRDKRPRLTVDPGCTNTLNEFESYVYRKGMEDPVKENDHALDSIRNLAYYLFAEEMEAEAVSYSPTRIDDRW